MNRRGIVERIQHELALVARDGRDLSVLMIDIDHFKAVNDTQGHAIGDEVLREVACRIRRQLRAYDDIGRIGGEEFAVLLPECGATGAMAVAERIRKSVGSDVVKTSAAAVQVTVSIGIADVDTLHEYEPAQVLAQADRALYEAKCGGRNRVEIGHAASSSPMASCKPG
jgi:diguanylate cyclase (GGDEF)-like protein